MVICYLRIRISSIAENAKTGKTIGTSPERFMPIPTIPLTMGILVFGDGRTYYIKQ